MSDYLQLPKTERRDLQSQKDNDEDQDNIDDEDGTSSKRGRPKIPEQWTRVFNVRSTKVEDIPVHVIASDLLLA